MNSFNEVNQNEELVSCPYNSNHRMSFQKLIYHISKGCKSKREKEHLFAVCPFNSLHIIKKQDIDNHIKNCLENNQNDSQVLKQDVLNQMYQTIQNQYDDKYIQQNKEQQYVINTNERMNNSYNNNKKKDPNFISSIFENVSYVQFNDQQEYWNTINDTHFNILEELNQQKPQVQEMHSYGMESIESSKINMTNSQFYDYDQ